MWDNKAELKFIEYFQTEPILWDTKHRYYKGRSLNNDAWSRIGELMDKPVPELKKESLFASYRKYRKMVKDSCRSGAGEDEIYKPIWFAYDALDSFLGDALTVRPTINTTSINIEESGSSTTEVETINENRNDTKTSQTRMTSRLLQGELKEAGKHVKDAISIFQVTIKKRESQTSQDDCDIYAMGLAKKLRAFSEDERLEIMYEIDGMIINHRRALRPNRFTNTTINPSSEYIRSSSALSSYSEPLPRGVVYRHNTRIAYSEPPQIHIPEEQHTRQVYLQNEDAQVGSNVQILSNELLQESQLSDVISLAYKDA